ncbi:hypothetical protein REPUB_Repub01dG0258000 [Reevesia pubescens]
MPQAIKIFSKRLTDTDIKKRLAIPAKALPSFPDLNGSHALDIHLMYGTKVWPIVCSIRKKGYKKPVFSSGWRNFVIHNNFNVGDRLTLYKVQDEDGSFHYKVEVEKQARASGSNLSSSSLSRYRKVDKTTGTSRTKVSNFRQKREQLPKADIASIKQEAAIMNLPDVATDAAPVAFIDHVIAKPSIWIFGTNVSDEATSKAHFKTEVQETEMRFFGLMKGICMGEPRSLKEEREIKSFGLAEGGAMAYSTSQAAGEAYYKSHTESLRLGFVLEQSTPYVGKLNLDLTLAPPILDGGQD